jgi:fatty-acyl-CoA synthase
MHYFSPLTPVTFLERSAKVFPDAAAVTDERRSVTYRQLLSRARRLAAALRALGVGDGDRVGLMADNCRQVIEANFGIPGAGAVVVSLNPWLPSEELAKQLSWIDCRVLLVSRACLARHGADVLSDAGARVLVVFGSSPSSSLEPKCVEYESVVEAAQGDVPLNAAVRNELDPIVINFTSGTTGTPKGVVMTHRAAYLHAVGQVLMMGLGLASHYLWTLPMFHVNGWGHMWANTVVGGTQVIWDLPSPTPEEESRFCARMRLAGITHLAGAPRLLRRIVALKGADTALRGCTIVTGGAAPAQPLLTELEKVGAKVIHQYGLNETLGPFVVCEEQASWASGDSESRAALRARQGVASVVAGTGLRVVSTDGREVPPDGKTTGEVVMSGNTVAMGYYRAEETTARAFVDGWFHTGDLAVVHSDGYLEIRDRIKDLIYVETEYGWENISSIEVENILVQCPGVGDAALLGVSGPDAQSAPQLIAVIESSPQHSPSFEELRGFCQQRLPAHMRPSRFLLSAIPKTATGKTRKDLLLARALHELSAPTGSTVST